MKKTLFVLLMFFVVVVKGQDIIIDTNSIYLKKLPFQDTIITSIDEWASCISDTSYFFDLDKDTSADMEFNMSCYMGGFGSEFRIEINSRNDFYLHVDTNYVEHFQYLDDDYVVQDTSRIVTVLKKYEYGDTANMNEVAVKNESFYLHHLQKGYDPPVIYDQIVQFESDTSYLALSRRTDESENLYFLKLCVLYDSRVQLMGLYTSDLAYGVKETKFTTFEVAPNPATNEIRINEEADRIEIFNLQGQRIYVNMNFKDGIIDVSGFPPALYMINLYKNKVQKTAKFIKK